MIFLDIDLLKGGVDFPPALKDAIDQSMVMLVIVGARWTEILREREGSDTPDFVQLEIEQALNNNIHIIPVLIDNVDMPSIVALPNRIGGLAHKQARRVTLSDFPTHVDRLATDILAEIKKRNPTVHRKIERGRFGKDLRTLSVQKNEIERLRLLHEAEIAALKGDNESLNAALLACREAKKT